MIQTRVHINKDEEYTEKADEKMTDIGYTAMSNEKDKNGLTKHKYEQETNNMNLDKIENIVSNENENNKDLLLKGCC